MVETIKANKLADQIRDYLSDWTLKDMVGSFFSITQVTLSTDLQEATVWIECLNTLDQTKIFARLQKNRSKYQHNLSLALARRSSPKIIFKIDNSPEILAHFDSLLKK
jgi:ribosome-binding factor A